MDQVAQKAVEIPAVALVLLGVFIVFLVWRIVVAKKKVRNTGTGAGGGGGKPPTRKK